MSFLWCHVLHILTITMFYLNKLYHSCKKKLEINNNVKCTLYVDCSVLKVEVLNKLLDVNFKGKFLVPNVCFSPFIFNVESASVRLFRARFVPHQTATQTVFWRFGLVCSFNIVGLFDISNKLRFVVLVRFEFF